LNQLLPKIFLRDAGASPALTALIETVQNFSLFNQHVELPRKINTII